MTPALWVTASRIVGIPIVMVLILLDTSTALWWAAAVYLVAAGTDSLDGWLARSRGQVTVAGAFLDPLADKLLVTAAAVALVEIGDMASWAVMVIVTREFAVTGLRLVAMSENLVIPAGRFGKAKTLAQNVALVAIIAPHGAKVIDDPLLHLALVMTVLSGAYYFIMARRRLFERRQPQPDMAGDP